MEKDSSTKSADSSRQSASPSAAEESLTDALNGLEKILERRQRGRPAAAPKLEPREPGAASADPQYTIPLLHDVVVPGGPGAAQDPADERAMPIADGIDDEESFRKLAERLANEIEVIVQARVEAAVGDAARDIREQVRNHLEIMLPEILEELKPPGRR